MVHGAVDGLTAEELTFRVDPAANSIAWLVWHLTRIEEDHGAGLAGTPQGWSSGGWGRPGGWSAGGGARRWRLPFDENDTGYGHGIKEVAAVTGDRDMLLGYFDA